MTEHYSSPLENGQPRARGTVGVMGSGRRSHSELAEPLGRRVAELGFHLLCGGGRGVMKSVCRGFLCVENRLGVTIGVCPGRMEPTGLTTPNGYPNEYVEVPILTHLPFSGEQGMDPLSRNHINVLSSDVVVALPGSSGTRSEVELALMYQRPVIAFLGPDGVIEGLGEGRVPLARDLEEVVAFLERELSPRS